MKERQNTKEPGLLDRILTDIFERELAAYADGEDDDKWAKERPDNGNGNGRKSSKVIADKVIAEDKATGLDNIELTETEESPAVSEENSESLSSFSNPAEDPYSETEVDNWSYEVPRPWLSLQEASSMLGRSERALERSILGRWGNRLPEGWSARKVRIDGQEEWRIIPPPGFRVKHSRSAERARVEEPETEAWPDDIDEELESESNFSSETPAETSSETMDQSLFYDMDDLPPQKTVKKVEDRQLAQSRDLVEPGPFSLEKLLQSATRLAQKELSAFAMPATKQRRERKDNYETTIVIDRSDEVEKLLRQLADCQKELAQERRQHLDDLRVMHEMQNSMRLLEVRAVETRELKEDLTLAQQALVEHRKQYQEFLALPWWRRLFHKM